MGSTCHMCGGGVDGSGDGEPEGWFECADCGGLTCPECRSIGVGRDSNHCRRCRG